MRCWSLSGAGMTEEQLEHLIRASGAIVGDNAVIIIGSQSIVPWLRKWAGNPPKAWPGVFTLSTEADVIPIDNDQHKSDLIDGSLGEDSYFHQSFGYYAQGVSMETPKAPEGWFSRCYPLVSQNTHQTIGHCMHPADLFVAKSVANRPKDGPFLDAMIEYGLVKEQTALHLSRKIPGLSPSEIADVQARIKGRFHRVQAMLSQPGEQGITSQPGHPHLEGHQKDEQGTWRTVGFYVDQEGKAHGSLRINNQEQGLDERHKLEFRERTSQSGIPMLAASVTREDGSKLYVNVLPGENRTTGEKFLSAALGQKGPEQDAEFQRIEGRGGGFKPNEAMIARGEQDRTAQFVKEKLGVDVLENTRAKTQEKAVAGVER